MTSDLNAVEYHQHLSSEWDNRYKTGSFARRAQLFRERILPDVPKGGNWLDAGCGSGYFSRILAKNGSEVIGQDGAEGMVKASTELAVIEGLSDKTRFEHVNTIEQLTFETGRFDGCICLSVLEYLPNPYACLDELCRVVRPGGWMIISVPHKGSVLRLAQKIARGSVKKKNSPLDYLASSQTAFDPKQLKLDLAARKMSVKKIVGFDALIPSIFHTILPPSLIYVLAQKDNA